MTAIRDASAPRATRLAGRGALVTLVMASVVVLGAPLALASSATLQAEVLTNPVPGWTPVPASTLSGVTTTFTKSVQAIASNATVAVDGFVGPSGASQILLIRLAQFSGGSVPSGVSLPQTVQSTCSGSGDKAGPTTSVSGIAGSVFVTCQGSGPADIESAAWPQGNVLAWIAAEGLSSSSVQQIARSQAAKLPASGSSSSSGTVGGVIIIVVVAAGVWFVVRRRRSNAQVAAAPAGAWLPPGGAAPPWGQPGGAPQTPYSGEAQPYAGQPGGYAGPGGYEPAAYQPPPAAGSQAGYEATQVGYQPAPAAGAAAPYGAEQAPYEQPGSPEETQTVAGAQAYQDLGTPAGQEEEPPGAEGWHPIDGDTNRQRYWDGTSWTSRMHWDGHAWVNDS
jgi:LPXTG-motif cell wall-anchored protein